jgi:hypothetical protein
MRLQTTATVPPELLLLADHLDAILAAGEDISKLAVEIESVRRQDGVTAPWERFGEVVGEAKLYELTIVSRTLQARKRAREVARLLGRDGAPFAPLLELFASGTAVLEDAVSELADRAGADFDGGLDPMPYLRTRGVIPADAGTLLGIRRLAIADTFMVARRIELGPLLDMVSALLDALDATYGLFEDERSAPSGRADPATSHDGDLSGHTAGT